MHPLTRATTGVVSALLAVALLTACSGDDSGESSPDGPTSAASGGPDLPVPDGTELTAQGSALAVGDTATVAWEPRQDTVGVIDMTVDRLEKTSFEQSFTGFRITDETKTTSPFFARVTITNSGDTDLGGRRIPLYAVDDKNRLVDYSGFASTFKPCPSTDFPKSFAPGETKEFCLVYLVPEKGDLTAVSFRPTEDVNPITWTGELTKPVKDKPAKGKPNKGKPTKGKGAGKNDEKNG